MEFLPLGDPVAALRKAREMVGRDVQAAGARDSG
jgi:hypothetical protein